MTQDSMTTIVAFIVAHMAILIIIGQLAFAAWLAASYAAPRLTGYPRIQGFAKLVIAISLDLVKLVTAIRQIVSGQQPSVDAKALFEAYRASVEASGQPAMTTRWEELPAAQQAHWWAVAHAKAEVDS